MEFSEGPGAGFDAVGAAYGLGAVRGVRYLADGLLNRNWRLDVGGEAFALKELSSTTPDAARRSLAVMTAAGADGVPVVEVVPDRRGALVSEIGDQAYYLARWVDGDHRRGVEMTPSASFHMGEMLGRVRVALARPGLLPGEEPRTEPPPSVATARERIGDYLELIGAKGETDEFDAMAVPLLRSRIELVAAHGHLRPEGPVVGPVGWIHGDCQNWNLIWQGERIAAVLDWDRLRVNAYGEEVVRASMYQCALPDGSVDLECISAMLDGYRSVAPISGAALLDAARRRWWRLITSVWHLKYHYYLGEPASDRVFFSDERLLRWWTANLAEVEAVFSASGSGVRGGPGRRT
ncbi:phosphotransferase [Glycomyces sp. NPDC047010]|uniref:phosphotransferase n=1 Tax=Glycomyces sp. NPDC047010 TaxID=3155023 RepID=UPI00340ACB8F